MLTAEALKAQARTLGFDLCGIAPATALPELARLREWLDRGYAGEMQYMHKSADTRADIRRLLPSARSVIVTGTVYHAGGGGPPAAAESPGIARYAWGEDYHLVLAARLERLLDWMRGVHAAPFEASIFVDKHHVQERVYAHHAGLGWLAKNTCLIHPDCGSWLFLSGMAVSLELPADAPLADQCGACTQCIDACPTGALVAERELDATKCISYLTIETEGDVPTGRRAMIGNHAWGCDICQDVCPWNLAAHVSSDPAWQGPQRDGLSASWLWQQSDDELHDRIKGSAMKYVPLSRLRRNLATIIGNSGDAEAVAALERPGRGVKNAARSAETPAVQAAVAWARRRTD